MLEMGSRWFVVVVVVSDWPEVDLSEASFSRSMPNLLAAIHKVHNKNVV